MSMHKAVQHLPFSWGEAVSFCKVIHQSRHGKAAVGHKGQTAPKLVPLPERFRNRPTQHRAARATPRALAVLFDAKGRVLASFPVEGRLSWRAVLANELTEVAKANDRTVASLKCLLTTIHNKSLVRFHAHGVSELVDNREGIGLVRRRGLDFDDACRLPSLFHDEVDFIL